MTFSRFVPKVDRSRPVPAICGWLRVGPRAGTHTTTGEAMFLVECARDLGGCGGRALVSGSALRCGATRSCGCLLASKNRARALDQLEGLRAQISSAEQTGRMNALREADPVAWSAVTLRFGLDSLDAPGALRTLEEVGERVGGHSGQWSGEIVRRGLRFLGKG